MFSGKGTLPSAFYPGTYIKNILLSVFSGTRQNFRPLQRPPLAVICRMLDTALGKVFFFFKNLLCRVSLALALGKVFFF
jgi:hypothetical protein